MVQCIMYRCKNIIDKFELLEMANAIPKYTGIDGIIIYFCTKSEMTNKQSHSFGRIKVRKGASELGSLSILLQDGLYIVKGFKSKDGKKILEKVKKFVNMNRKLLWDYWNTDPEEADSASVLTSFKKVK